MALTTLGAACEDPEPGLQPAWVSGGLFLGFALQFLR